MSNHMPDVDIDVKERTHALSGHKFVQASLLQGEVLKKHPSGVYFQNVPVDPVTGYCSIPNGTEAADLATELGFFKLDLIPSHAYDNIKNPAHLEELLQRPTPWEKFLDKEVLRQLQQLGRHYEIVTRYPPKSIEDLSCLIAIIRPGKKHLIGQDWEFIRSKIWEPDESGYYYKKSHAVAFAISMTVQLKALMELNMNANDGTLRTF